MWDFPKTPLRTLFLGELTSATFDFEVCVVCLGQPVSRRNPLEIYGCAKWGFSYFNATPGMPIRGAQFSRYIVIDGVRKFTNSWSKPLTVTDIAGDDASDTWKTVVWWNRGPIGRGAG
jgi:hypothetical protein